MDKFAEKIKDKKIIFLSCNSTIFEHYSKFDNFKNNSEFIIVSYKNSIELLDYKADYFLCDDRENGLDMEKVNAVKIYTGSLENKPVYYDYHFCALADSCSGIVTEINENKFCVDEHLYEFILGLGLFSYFKPKAIYLFGFHIFDGEIDKFFDIYGHFYKGEITPRDKTSYYLYYRIIDNLVPFLRKTSTKCYTVSKKGVSPFSRIEFDQIFLDEPDSFTFSDVPDPMEEFKERIDIKFYTEKHKLDPNSNIHTLFYHYFIYNEFHLDENNYHLFPNEERKFMITEKDYKDFSENIKKNCFEKILKTYFIENEKSFTEFFLKNYYFYRGKNENWSDSIQCHDLNNKKLVVLPYCVPKQSFLCSNVKLMNTIDFYKNKYELKDDEIIYLNINEAMISAHNISLKKIGKISAIIPVRRGSVRCKNKNMRKFFDTNLLELKLKTLKNIPEIYEIIVSSDDDEYLETALKYNVKIDKRPYELCTEHAKPEEVCKYLCSITDTENIIYCTVVTPFLTENDYKNIIEIYRNDTLHTSVASAKLFKSFLWNENEPVNYSLKDMPISQNLPKYYIPTFGATIFTRERGLIEGTVLGNKPLFYETTELSGIDIDTSLDFAISELLYKNGIKEISDVYKYLDSL